MSDDWAVVEDALTTARQQIRANGYVIHELDDARDSIARLREREAQLRELKDANWNQAVKAEARVAKLEAAVEKFIAFQSAGYVGVAFAETYAVLVREARDALRKE